MLKTSEQLERFRDSYRYTFLEALELAIDLCGGVVKLSSESGIDYSTLYRWRNGNLGRFDRHDRLLNFLKEKKE